MVEPFPLYSTEFDRDPFAAYASLRDTFPCYWSEEAQMWVLSRYEDVLSASLEWSTFSSLKGNLLDEIPGRTGNTLGSTDPPRHDRLRRLAQTAFARGSIGHLQERIIQIVDCVLSEIDDVDSFDFSAQFADRITVRVLFELLGLPHRDPNEVRAEVQAAMSTDKSIRAKNRTQIAAYTRLTAFLSEQIQSKRHDTSDDLISNLASAEIDGNQLREDEVVHIGSMLVVAGVESLSSFMSVFVLNLLQNPRALIRTRDDPSLIAFALEESLRFNTSAQRFKRVLTRDVELHGYHMREGDQVALLYGSANRDPRKFDNPDIYDIDRNPRGHLGFGSGPHYCLGTSLARTVAAISIGKILSKFPNLSLVKYPQNWVSSSNFRSPQELIVSSS